MGGPSITLVAFFDNWAFATCHQLADGNAMLKFVPREAQLINLVPICGTFDQVFFDTSGQVQNFILTLLFSFMPRTSGKKLVQTIYISN